MLCTVVANTKPRPVRSSLDADLCSDLEPVDVLVFALVIHINIALMTVRPQLSLTLDDLILSMNSMVETLSA